MADSSLVVKDASGTNTNLATDLTAGVHTPKHLALQSGTWAVDINNSPSVNQAGTWSVSVSGTVTVATHAVTQSGTWTVSPTLTTTGGLTPYNLISAAGNNLTSVKTTAGTLGSVVATNNHATAIRYLKLYNKASAPVVASDVPVQVYALAPNGGGVALVFANGMAFGTGIAFAITGGMANTDATSIGASEVAVSLGYK